MILDQQTVLFMSFIFATIAYFVVLSLFFLYRRRFFDVTYWLIGFSLILSGFAFIALRAFLSFYLSVLVANIIIPIGHLFIIYGILKFFNIKFKITIDITFFLLYTLLFIGFLDDINMRIIFVSIFSIMIALRPVITFMLNKVNNKRHYAIYIYLPNLILIIVGLLRFINIIINPMDSNDLLEQNLVNSFANIMFSVLFIILSINLFLIINRRLLFDNKEKEERFVKAFSGSSTAMLISEVETSKIIDVNQAFINMSGYIEEQLIDKQITQLGFWTDLENRDNFIQTIKSKGSVSNIQMPFYNKSQVKIETLVSSSLIENAETPYLLTTLTDITAIEKAKSKLEYLATHDFLTSLYNRAYFYDYFESTVKESNKTHLIILLDLNCFKNVNDRFGHDVGDQVLIQIAKNIQPTSKETHLSARYGGDEFIIIKQIEDDQIESFITLVRHKLNESFIINDYRFQFDAAFGHAVYPYDSKKLYALIKLADERLYIEKETLYTCERVVAKIK